MLGGAFFWLLSVLLCSIWWYIIPPLYGALWFAVLFDVAIQEAVRLLFAKIYKIMSTRFLLVSKQLPNRVLVSLAFGAGWGVTYVVVNYITVLWEAAGPADLYTETCSSSSLFVISGLNALGMNLLNIVLSVITVESFCLDKKFFILLVFILHYGASYFTLLNYVNCYASFLLIFLLVIIGLISLFLLLSRSPFVIRKNE
eukprot:TRINITY_DN25547_c0_g1_i1.p1 TRINITY_DN25547_c0_g1~~TRINITY_DN25547_c0_g1_i1.p1  ORF type:complete len:232 (+),score=31.84 TRINITY_DN25547_c0_g1_i1:98-697(+)